MEVAFGKYVRVCLDHPCPICGKSDWCLLHASGNKAVCTRVKSGLPFGEQGAGWTHYLGSGQRAVKINMRPKKRLSYQQVQRFLDECPQDLEDHARNLRLSVDSLRMIQTRYLTFKAALAFPMFDGRRNPIGVRFRRKNGGKWSLKGGREGVFLSAEFNADSPIVVVEGATDAATLCHAGYTNVIGRPNCVGGALIIKQLARNTSVPVLILADPDEPGIDGAQRLCDYLPNPARVMLGPSDVHEYFTYLNHDNLPARVLHDILDNVENTDESTEWKCIDFNHKGKFFPFTQSYRA